jgi:chemotaxis protein CheD
MTVKERVTNVIQGDFLISDDPNEILTTVLGSCIAVCLYDTTRMIGGMNHFLLANSKSGAPSDNVRYGANAMELLINGLLKQGAQKQRLEAKIFGGASMMGNARQIGATNAEFAKTFLKEEGIPCTGESTGGTSARRIKFWPTSGRVRQLMVSGDVVPAAPPPKPKPVQDDITLF